MKKSILTSVFATLMLLFISYNGNAQNLKTQTKTTVSQTIEVIQFHSEHRCVTCLKIEELTKETLKSYPKISFKLFNVDDSKNKKIAEQFQAIGTSLFLYNPSTKKKKDLTEFAFMNAGDKTKFIKELQAEINKF